jgi:hypothetical protein
LLQTRLHQREVHLTAMSVPEIPGVVSAHRMTDHFPSLPIPGLAPVGHVERPSISKRCWPWPSSKRPFPTGARKMRVKQSQRCFTRHVSPRPIFSPGAFLYGCFAGFCLNWRAGNRGGSLDDRPLLFVQGIHHGLVQLQVNLDQF